VSIAFGSSGVPELSWKQPCAVMATGAVSAYTEMVREAPHVSAAFPLHGMLQADAASTFAGEVSWLPAQQFTPSSTPNML
jgi:hypothetical protein